MTNARFQAAYLELLASGELANRAAQVVDLLQDCTLCPNNCHVNRQVSAKGARCLTGRRARLASYGPHHGEEAPLVGRFGSGTIFFSNCNLHCNFCQNWQISQQGEGQEVTAGELARVMLGLQAGGCHNINLVSPSHVIAQILEALLIAAEQGLRLPLVYNTGGYDSVSTLQLLDGIVDIYMPDVKFADSAIASTYLGVNDYAEVNRAAVKEMHRQVGDLQLAASGTAQRGLLVRHLVLPENLAGTDRSLDFLAHEISAETYLNLMGQYRPCYRACDSPPLDRRPNATELAQAATWAKERGLNRLDKPTLVLNYM